MLDKYLEKIYIYCAKLLLIPNINNLEYLKFDSNTILYTITISDNEKRKDSKYEDYNDVIKMFNDFNLKDIEILIRNKNILTYSYSIDINSYTEYYYSLVENGIINTNKIIMLRVESKGYNYQIECLDDDYFLIRNINGLYYKVDGLDGLKQYIIDIIL